MSMEITVLSDRRLRSLAEWQRAIDAEALGIALPTDTSIDELHGFLPVRWNGVATGFECSHCDPAEIMTLYREIAFGRKWTHALDFIWGGDFDEGLTAYMAAAAYAKAADGVVFDTQDGIVMSPQRALEVAREMKREIPKVKAALEKAYGTKLKGGP
jgi:hypothetical protein